MDFIISLAHFCELHGPTSIFSTQVQPSRCLTCSPPRSNESTPPQTSSGPVLPEQNELQQHRSNSEPISRAHSFSRRTEPLPEQKSGLLNRKLEKSQYNQLQANETAVISPLETPPMSPRGPGPSEVLHVGSLDRDSLRRSTSSNSETCLNCSMSLPKGVSEQIPDGLPGSPTKDGKGKNGSPVLRTKDVFLSSTKLGSSSSSSSASDSPKSPQSSLHHSTKPSRESLRSGTSNSSPATSLNPQDASRFSTATNATITPLTFPSTHPHNHSLTYLTTSSPPNPPTYSMLRRSIIRTLSCELLPHNTSSGPLVFGDRTTGSTIAFVFRLPDARARHRGRKRIYALLLVGREEARTMRVAGWVLRRFERIARGIVGLAEGVGAELLNGAFGRSNARPGTADGADEEQKGSITPVSSFLAGRPVDPDGYPRHAEVRARGLAELTGREDIFVALHWECVRMLMSLVRGFEGDELFEDGSLSGEDEFEEEEVEVDAELRDGVVNGDTALHADDEPTSFRNGMHDSIDLPIRTSNPTEHPSIITAAV